MSDLHTERMIQHGRILALLVATGLLISFGDDRSVLMTSAVAVLAVATLATALGLRHARGRVALRSLGAASFAADAVVCGLTLAAVADDPIDPVSAVTFLIAVEAALRWGRVGAVAGGLLAGGMATAWAAAGYEAIGRELPAASIAFRTLSNVMIALPVGLLIERLRSHRSHTGQLFETAGDAVLVIANDRVLDANPAAADLAGRSLGRLLGRRVSDVLPVVADDTPPRAADGHTDVGVRTAATEDPSGHVRWLSITTLGDGSDPRIVVLRDVTDQTERERALHQRALHDPVTGLANRAAMHTHLADRIAEPEPLGVVFLDLDDFKVVNDRFGHIAGDRLLQAIGERLRTVTREGDVAYRWAGDEFCVVVPGATADGLSAMAGRIGELFERPFTVDGEPVLLRASVGTAMAQPGDDEERLVGRADVAMYVDKRRGSTGDGSGTDGPVGSG